MLIQGTVPTSVHHASCIHRSQRSCSKSADNPKIAFHLKQRLLAARSGVQVHLKACGDGSLHLCCLCCFLKPKCIYYTSGSQSQARASARWATGSRKSSTSFRDGLRFQAPLTLAQLFYKLAWTGRGVTPKSLAPPGCMHLGQETVPKTDDKDAMASILFRV